MAGEPVRDLAGMLAGMGPALHPDPWQFILVEGETPQNPFALIREDEGVTAIVAGAGDGPAFARITLMVHSALEGVGLTAAVSGALAAAGIACNIVAAFHHDHLFVPWDRRDEVLALLRGLTQAA